MAKETQEESKEEPKEEKKPEVEIVEIVKEKGIGLTLPNGTILDVSDVSVGLVQWMTYITLEINEMRKNLA